MGGEHLHLRSLVPLFSIACVSVARMKGVLDLITRRVVKTGLGCHSVAGHRLSRYAESLIHLVCDLTGGWPRISRSCRFNVASDGTDELQMSFGTRL